jgi:hypothetical protein
MREVITCFPGGHGLWMLAGATGAGCDRCDGCGH